MAQTTDLDGGGEGLVQDELTGEWVTSAEMEMRRAIRAQSQAPVPSPVDGTGWTPPSQSGGGVQPSPAPVLVQTWETDSVLTDGSQTWTPPIQVQEDWSPEPVQSYGQNPYAGVLAPDLTSSPVEEALPQDLGVLPPDPAPVPKPIDGDVQKPLPLEEARPVAEDMSASIGSPREVIRESLNDQIAGQSESQREGRRIRAMDDTVEETLALSRSRLTDQDPVIPMDRVILVITAGEESPVTDRCS